MHRSNLWLITRHGSLLVSARPLCLFHSVSLLLSACSLRLCCIQAYDHLASAGSFRLGTLIAHGAGGWNPQVKLCQINEILYEACLKNFLFGSYLPSPSHTPSAPFTCFSSNSALHHLSTYFTGKLIIRLDISRLHCSCDLFLVFFCMFTRTPHFHPPTPPPRRPHMLI